MALIANRTKEKLAAGELALGLGLRLARMPEIAKIAAVCGYDWLFVDLEHGAFSVDTAAQICAAALDAGISPIPRASAHEHFHATRLLDAGAQGIVVPHVDSRAQAEAVRDNCLYPPVGRRSVAGGMAQLEYEALPTGEAARLINGATLTVVMIETAEAVEAADAIAAVEGIDALLIGTNDLCATMGIPGQFGHDRVTDAYDRVVSAARNNGKHAGMGGVYDEELAGRYIAMGARLVLAGNDLPLLMGAARARAGFLRGLV